MPHEKGQKRQRVASRVSTRCVCGFNVLSLRFQRVVFAVSTCCVCGFNVLKEMGAQFLLRLPFDCGKSLVEWSLCISYNDYV